jgi:transcriptional regulator GlxA family with amidase domain
MVSFPVQRAGCRTWRAHGRQNSDDFCQRRCSCLRERLAESKISAVMRKRLVFLVVPPVDELDLVGPMEVFGTANRLLGGRGGPKPYAVEVVTTARDRRIDGECGLSLLADRRYHDVSGRSDSVLVICGVGARAMRDRALFGWLRRVAATTRRLGSVCVGAFLLAEAGLLDGRRVTAHWRYARELADRYPRVAVDPRPTWVRDGNIYTSAGISAGIDLGLAWVEEDFGTAAALKVARELVLFLRRPGGQDQISVSLEAQATHTKSMHDLDDGTPRPAPVGRHTRQSRGDERAELRAGVRSRVGHHSGPLSPSIARGGCPAAPGANRQESHASGDRLRLPGRRRHAPGLPESPGYDTASISASFSDSGHKISHAVGRAPRSAGRRPTRNSEGRPRRHDLKPPVETGCR